MDHTELLSAGLRTGAIYVTLAIAIRLLFPPVASLVWQSLLGPALIRRWPSVAQAEHRERYSYLRPGHPVVGLNLDPPSMTELSQAFRDCFSTSFLLVLAPWLAPVLLGGIALFIVVRHAFEFSHETGTDRTDRAFWAVRDGLLFVALVLALRLADVLS